MIKVFIDGACEPTNPGGTASYGLIVYRDSKRIYSECKVIGSGVDFSNNVAEYAGLLAFLRLRKGNEPFTVFSDSQLLCNQMSGLWAARKGLYLPYYKEAMALCGGLPATFTWICREDNTEADTLSVQALAECGIKVRGR